MAKGWSVYLDEVANEDMERVRAYYVEKNEGRPVGDSEIGRNLLREKNADIINHRTKSLTLGKVYEEVLALRLEMARVLELLEAKQS